MLTELRDAKKVVGVKQLQKALREGAVVKVFVSEDAEARVTRPVVEACRESGVEVVFVGSMSELGAACSIQVGAAVAGILK